MRLRTRTLLNLFLLLTYRMAINPSLRNSDLRLVFPGSRSTILIGLRTPLPRPRPRRQQVANLALTLLLRRPLLIPILIFNQYF